MKTPASAAVGYGLHLSKDIERRLKRYRASVRSAIHDRLDEIAQAAAKGPQSEKKIDKTTKKTDKTARRPEGKEPPLRFYVYEGYRIFYQLDARTRRVVVLDLGTVAA